jgi:hypothetical protein
VVRFASIDAVVAMAVERAEAKPEPVRLLLGLTDP